MSLIEIFALCPPRVGMSFAYVDAGDSGALVGGERSCDCLCCWMDDEMEGWYSGANDALLLSLAALCGDAKSAETLVVVPPPPKLLCELAPPILPLLLPP